MELYSFLPGAMAAIPTLHMLTHPKSRIKKRFLPKLKYSRIELNPKSGAYIRLKMGNKSIGFHHWMNFAIILAVSIPATWAVLDAHFTKGFLAGGILQGLLYSDRHKIFFTNKSKKLKKS